MEVCQQLMLSLLSRELPTFASRPLSSLGDFEIRLVFQAMIKANSLFAAAPSSSVDPHFGLVGRYTQITLVWDLIPVPINAPA